METGVKVDNIQHCASFKVCHRFMLRCADLFAKFEQGSSADRFCRGHSIFFRLF